MSQVRIYGVGGFGVNIAKAFRNKERTEVSFLDTSTSNLDQDEVGSAFLVAGLDGSGKLRKQNVDAIKSAIAPVLNGHPPAAFNVVVFSGSGGTGSVLGPLLVDELLNRDAMVLVVFLGDTDSLIASENTLNTIKTLSALSARHKAPISILYREIEDGSDRTEVDEVFRSAITAFSLLTSLIGRPLSEMDNADLYNWLNYHRVTKHAPGLGLLNIFSDNDQLQDFHGALSVASIYATTMDEHGKVQAAYRTTGYGGDAVTHPYHFILTQDGFQAIVEALTRTVKELTEQSNQVENRHQSFHDGSAEDDFLVL